MEACCIALGEAGVCGNEVVMNPLVLMSQNHNHFGSPYVYKARWCVRQVMGTPADES